MNPLGVRCRDTLTVLYSIPGVSFLCHSFASESFCFCFAARGRRTPSCGAEFGLAFLCRTDFGGLALSALILLNTVMRIFEFGNILWLDLRFSAGLFRHFSKTGWVILSTFRGR